MRAGWNERDRNAPVVARLVQDAGASAITIHGRTAEQSYGGSADWDLVAQVANSLHIPVFGSGDCIEADDVVRRMASGVSGVLVGRGVLRNPWILAQAADIAAGRAPAEITLGVRGQFLRDYIQLLLDGDARETRGFRHVAPGATTAVAHGRHRWVMNKIRALCSWYSKGLEGGSVLRTRVNGASNLEDLHAIVDEFFGAPVSV
jgi:tRNA-dihydrouridine synthase B